MARTTPTDVANIFDTDLSTAADGPLSDWIGIATEVVDDIAAQDPSISDTRLAKIEKLVAAHYAAAQDPRIESTGAETKSVSYKSETGMGLRQTSYGQTAIQLDPTGTLSTIGKPTASVSVPDIKDLPK